MSKLSYVCLFATGLIIGTFATDAAFPHTEVRWGKVELHDNQNGLPGMWIQLVEDHGSYTFSPPDPVFARCTRLQFLCPVGAKVQLSRTVGLFGLHEKYEVVGVYWNDAVGDEI